MKEQVKLLIDLRGLRQEVGMSLASVEKLSGVSEATFARMESGDSPSLANALQVARFLQMPVEEIWSLDATKKG